MPDPAPQRYPAIDRTVFFVSDGTGITAETFGHSVLTQFELRFKQIRLPFIDTLDKAYEAVRKINEAFRADGKLPIVFSTLVKADLSSVVRQSNGMHMDLIQTFVVPLEQLQTAAERALASEIAAGNLPAGTQVRVLTAPLGLDEVTPARGFLAAEHPRLLATAQVSLWGDAGAADRAARAQLPRYLALVGGLVLVMLVGVVATYRGAARERELGKLKSDFVSTVSHELKTPLTSIRMFGEMLREGVGEGDPERQRRYHDVIVRESERLGRLIANVLDFSQIEKGARRYDPKPVAAAALAAEAVETFQRLADGEGHAMRVEIDDGAAGALVAVDREAMVQSMLNLLSNAAKYGGKEAPVVVRVAARPGEVRVAVIDRGPGIAVDHQKRIFREFWRAPEARRSGVEGTGLGLALVKRHVEAHGGRIEIESAPGQGATFTLVLPRALAAEGEEAAS